MAKHWDSFLSYCTSGMEGGTDTLASLIAHAQSSHCSALCSWRNLLAALVSMACAFCASLAALSHVEWMTCSLLWGWLGGDGGVNTGIGSDSVVCGSFGSFGLFCSVSSEFGMAVDAGARISLVPLLKVTFSGAITPSLGAEVTTGLLSCSGSFLYTMTSHDTTNLWWEGIQTLYALWFGEKPHNTPLIEWESSFSCFDLWTWTWHQEPNIHKVETSGLWP